MTNQIYISISANKFTEICKNHSRNNKKLRALFNHSEFKKNKTLHLLKNANEEYKRGFLDDEDERYLNAKIDKLKIDPNTWCYKYSKWIKEKLTQTEKTKVVQLNFPFDEDNRGVATSF